MNNNELYSLGFNKIFHNGKDLFVLNINDLSPNRDLTISYSENPDVLEISISEENSDFNIDIGEFRASYYIFDLTQDRFKSLIFGLTGKKIR